MGFYLKKGFNLGPVRINLSKSGLGVSVGAKGLRLGAGPKGSYLHAGRQGLYYRKSLGGKWWLVIVGLAIVAGAAYWLLSSGIITINF